jgi:hypothetical protein
VSLLLAVDQVELFAPPPGSDEHGWALEPTAQVWTGPGNLQRAPGRADAYAGTGGGHGPYDPAHSSLAVLYLPPDAPVADGVLAVIGGQSFALSQARYVTDPRGSGDLDCWTATATGTGTYGGS